MKQTKAGYNLVEWDVEKLTAKIVETVERELRSNMQTCLNCQHFSEAIEKCELNFMRPPARIIAHGCECWSEEIPF